MTPRPLWLDVQMHCTSLITYGAGGNCKPHWCSVECRISPTLHTHHCCTSLFFSGSKSQL